MNWLNKMNKLKLFSYPLIIIGVSLILLGARWMLVSEPWMLDEVANVERLQMSFSELFEPEINSTLPGYLRQIYRFFGFWVVIIGLFITLFSNPEMLKNKLIAKRVLFVLGLMLLIGAILGYSLIPSSHFIYLIWIKILMYIVSIYGYIGIDYAK
tara:strand:+ start:165 stop:629 length:465 start_codon:yes stop_codon:yes gene_type:complete